MYHLPFSLWMARRTHALALAVKRRKAEVTLRQLLYKLIIILNYTCNLSLKII